MKTFEGKAIFKGIAIGNVLFYGAQEETVTRTSITDAAAEVKRFEDAKEKAIEDLNKLHDEAVVKVGE